MKWLCAFAVCLFALALITAALIYPFHSKFAQELLKKGGMLTLGLLILPSIVVQMMQQADALTLFIMLALASVAAYFIREARKSPRGSAPVQARGGGERKPVLPPSGEES